MSGSIEVSGRPDEFNAFWDGVDNELEGYPASPELEVLPIRSTDFCTVYWVKLTSIGPYRIGGYLSIPHGDGPFPGIMNTPRYGSVNAVPDYNDRKRYVVLTLMHRGQRLANQPFAAAYPGLLTHGIEDPEQYIYRGILADCLRGAEYFLSRPEVDDERTAILGDDLALITAARRPGFAHVFTGGLLFHRLMEAHEQTSAYPIEEINDYLRGNPGHQQAVARTLSLFDPVHHVPLLTARTVISVGDAGSMASPEWLAGLMGAHQGPVEQYQLTHEGGTDHDQLDAWLAERLRVQPMSRFIREV